MSKLHYPLALKAFTSSIYQVNIKTAKQFLEEVKHFPFYEFQSDSRRYKHNVFIHGKSLLLGEAEKLLLSLSKLAKDYHLSFSNKFICIFQHFIIHKNQKILAKEISRLLYLFELRLPYDFLTLLNSLSKRSLSFDSVSFHYFYQQFQEVVNQQLESSTFIFNIKLLSSSFPFEEFEKRLKEIEECNDEQSVVFLKQSVILSFLLPELSILSPQDQKRFFSFSIFLNAINQFYLFYLLNQDMQGKSGFASKRFLYIGNNISNGILPRNLANHFLPISANSYSNYNEDLPTEMVFRQGDLTEKELRFHRFLAKCSRDERTKEYANLIIFERYFSTLFFIHLLFLQDDSINNLQNLPKTSFYLHFPNAHKMRFYFNYFFEFLIQDYLKNKDKSTNNNQLKLQKFIQSTNSFLLDWLSALVEQSFLKKHDDVFFPQSYYLNNYICFLSYCRKFSKDIFGFAELFFVTRNWQNSFLDIFEKTNFSPIFVKSEQTRKDLFLYFFYISLEDNLSQQDSSNKFFTLKSYFSMISSLAQVPQFSIKSHQEMFSFANQYFFAFSSCLKNKAVRSEIMSILPFIEKACPRFSIGEICQLYCVSKVGLFIAYLNTFNKEDFPQLKKKLEEIELSNKEKKSLAETVASYCFLN